jgi:hypothetical protein
MGMNVEGQNVVLNEHSRNPFFSPPPEYSHSLLKK